MVSIFRPCKLEKYNCSGTIQDFVVCMLGSMEKPVMSPQNAASWGYFNCEYNDWNRSILSKAGFPVDLLPNIAESGAIVGYLNEGWHGIPKGTPIGK